MHSSLPSSALKATGQSSAPAQSILCFSPSISISFAWCSLNSCSANPGTNLVEPSAGRGSLEQQTLPGWQRKCKPQHCWGQILMGSSGCVLHAAPASPGSHQGTQGITSGPAVLGSPQRGTFEYLNCRSAFRSCSCGATEPLTHWEHCWPMELQGGHRRGNCTALHWGGEGDWGFLYPSGYFGPLSLLNDNSSSTVMGEWAGNNLPGLWASREWELESINEKKSSCVTHDSKWIYSEWCVSVWHKWHAGAVLQPLHLNDLEMWCSHCLTPKTELLSDVGKLLQSILWEHTGLWTFLGQLFVVSSSSLLQNFDPFQPQVSAKRGERITPSISQRGKSPLAFGFCFLCDSLKTSTKLNIPGNSNALIYIL